MEKLCNFKLYRVDDDTLVYEAINIQYWKLRDYLDAYWNFFLKEIFYYKIEEQKNEI